MATLRNSVLLIGKVGIMVIDDDENLIAFPITIKEHQRNDEGDWVPVITEVNCIAVDKTAEKLRKDDLYGQEIAIEGHLISDKDDSDKNHVITHTYTVVDNYYLLER